MPSDRSPTSASDGPDDLIERVRERRLRLTRSGPTRERVAGDFERVGLPPADCDVLRDLLADERVRTIIEIGLAYGGSALAVAEALLLVERIGGDRPLGPGPNQIIVDAHQTSIYGDVGRSTLSEAGVIHRCRIETDRSQLVLPRLVDEGVRVDAAFVDGSHIFHNVFVDLHFLRELVRPGGLLVLDDCDWPSVRTAVRYFEHNTGWIREPVATPTRLRAYRLPDPRLEPSFDEFVPFGPDADQPTD